MPTFKFPSMEDVDRRVLAGPGRKARFAFYRQYVPIPVARRLALSFAITPGAKRYKANLIKYLKSDEWLGAIKLRMRYDHESREVAIVNLWSLRMKAYEKFGQVKSANEYLGDWLFEVLSP